MFPCKTGERNNAAAHGEAEDERGFWLNQPRFQRFSQTKSPRTEVPTGAAGQGEVEDEGGGEDGQHLLSQQARLELEQLLEGGLHLPRVGAPPPVPRHMVRVRHHLHPSRAWGLSLGF